VGKDGMTTELTGLCPGGIPTPTCPSSFFFSPDRWEELINWNRNPVGVILERQAKRRSVLDILEVTSTIWARKGWGTLTVSKLGPSTNLCKVGMRILERGEPHRSSPSWWPDSLPGCGKPGSSVHPGMGNRGRTSGHPAAEQPGAVWSLRASQNKLLGGEPGICTSQGGNSSYFESCWSKELQYLCFFSLPPAESELTVPLQGRC